MTGAIMDKINISKDEAKRFLVNYQGLSKLHANGNKEGIESYVKKVGCIQFDPLNVVGRNPDLVMQSRIKDYSPEMLDELLYTDRILIDGWDKMMSIYLTSDWPYMKRIRQQHVEENIRIMTYRESTESLTYLERVKATIENEGAKFSREINFGGIEKGRWSSNKYSNIALDHLFHMGEIGILKKKNNQKCFDLIEKLLPKQLLDIEDPFSSEDEFLKWYIKRRISSIGMLWSRNGGGWLGHCISDKKKRDRIMSELMDEESIFQVNVEGVKEPLYTQKKNLIDLQNNQNIENKEIRILAPLDNLLWDRGLIESIFNFKYSWEVYVPESKRKYGYYVLPILYGENIIARFEPMKNIVGEPFQIKNWWWEEGVDINETLLAEIEKGLSAFTKYLGVKNESKAYMDLNLYAK